MANNILAKMAVVIDAQTAEFNKKLKDTEKSFNVFTKQLSSLGTTLVTAFGVQQVAEFGLEVSKLAGEAEGVSAAFGKLPDSEALMTKLKDATSGTVTELDLMKRTVQATNFGISLQSLPQLLEFAAVRAQQTGQSVDYLVDSIITGIGRKSPLILDNLGISAVALGEKLDGVSVAAASVGQVADAVGKIASEQLLTMGEYSENTATKVQRLNASWGDFKVAIGTAANESGVLNTALTILTDTLDGLAGKNKLGFAQGDLAAFISKDAAGLIDDAVEKLKELRREAGKPLQFNTHELVEKFQLTGEQADLLAQKIIEINNALSTQELRIKIFKDFAKGYEDINAAADAFNQKQYQEIVNLQIQQDNYRQLSAIGKKNFDEEIAQLTEQIGYRRNLIQAVKNYVSTLQTVPEAVKTTNALDLNTINGLNERIKELTDIKNDSTAATIGKINVEIEALQSKVKRLQETGLFSEKDSLDTSAFAGFNFDKIESNIVAGVDRSIASMESFRDQLAVVTEDINILEGEIADSVGRSGLAYIEFQGIAQSALSSFGEAMGNAIAGTENFGDAVLKAVLNFAKQFGEILIASGIAALAFQKLAISPPLAIAAGVALVALAGAAQATLNKTQKGLGAFSGSSAASTTSARSSSKISSSSDVQDVQVSVTGMLRGKDIYLAGHEYTKAAGYTKG